MLRYFGRRRDKKRVSSAKRKLANELINDYRCRSFSSIERFMDDMKWVADDFKGLYDYSKKPEITVSDMKGDCDDFAMLWKELLDKDDTESIMFSVISRRLKGHVMLAVKQDNRFYIMSNTSYKRYRGRFFEDVIKKASSDFYKDVLSIYLYDSKGYPDKKLKI